MSGYWRWDDDEGWVWIEIQLGTAQTIVPLPKIRPILGPNGQPIHQPRKMGFRKERTHA